MRIAIQKPLFAWDSLEDHPPLVTLRRRFEAIPDGSLWEGLRTYRGRGRRDFVSDEAGTLYCCDRVSHRLRLG